MVTLHITNLTGSPLPFTCSPPTESQWTHIEHEANLTTFASGRGKRPRTYIYVRSALPSAYPVDKKDGAVKSTARFPSAWVFKIRRPRALHSKEPWSALKPICPHIVQSYPRIVTDCHTCRQDMPWNVYVLHDKGGSRVLFLPQRDMSAFLSQTEDERPLSDVVLPGTHDSLAFYGWPVSQCQSPNQPLFTQLMSGIRVLDVRLSVVDGVLMAYHGAAPQRTSFSAILHTLHHFLQERPRECLVVSLKQEDYAYTSAQVFSRLVREEIERGEGGMAMWWLENRVPRLGEVRGRCIMLSRFGGDGKEWENGLEGMGIHPTKWPDSEQQGFEWDLKGTTVKTHDWYRIPNLLALPEKASLCMQNMVPPISDPPILGITFLSAAGGALSLPPFCALGVGWPDWGMGVEGINARIGRWLINRLTSVGMQDFDSEKEQWSISSESAELLSKGSRTFDTLDDDSEPKLPIRGWVFMDYFAEPDGALVPLLVENNFIRRSN
ncbi:phosphatidylinositol-specific phospholipase C, X domain protein [Rhizoctonia solani 123E]|uniref:Phosphatidylinositol-specific phospholipase C, X domain protein n=1 Tax=Rhizoctonia solani 123E TaxID=1423351 RepID=A0A074S6P6_9AGAM|nr:phosphatidylinositol-specific phospholipase C, X domain protein [Rhizoctonia solani 123E]